MFGLFRDKEGRSVLDLRPVVTAGQRPCGSHLGPKRTRRFVICLSLAVFDRSKPKELPRAPNLMRERSDLAPRPRLRLTRSEIAIHEFGRHRHHDNSKNPAHHTTGSKLAPRQAVLKVNLDAPPLDNANDGSSPNDISGCSLSFLTGSAVLARSLFPSSVR